LKKLSWLYVLSYDISECFVECGFARYAAEVWASLWEDPKENSMENSAGFACASYLFYHEPVCFEELCEHGRSEEDFVLGLEEGSATFFEL